LLPLARLYFIGQRCEAPKVSGHVKSTGTVVRKTLNAFDIGTDTSCQLEFISGSELSINKTFRASKAVKSSQKRSGHALVLLIGMDIVNEISRPSTNGDKHRIKSHPKRSIEQSLSHRSNLLLKMEEVFEIKAVP